MRLCACLLLIAALAAAAPAAMAQSAEPWLPVTPQDLAIKAVPGHPGAPAIQLYLSYYRDDNDDFISEYRRIKILADSGKKYADRDIPLEPGESLKQVRARTIHPDGSIVDFTGKPIETTVFKARGVKYKAVTFIFPDVTTGSIVEYSCLITLPHRVVRTISQWPIQSDLYTLKERLRFRAYQGLVNMPTEWGGVSHKTEVAYSYLNQVSAEVPQKKQGNLMELELENVAAFDGEEYMPPEDDYKPAVLFYYGGREAVSPDKFWEEWQRLFAEYQVKFSGNSGTIRDAAVQAIGSETDPEKKLRKLYARAQLVRNLSFERERSKEEEKGENLKHNSSAQDVLQHGYGDHWEIDAMFVALVRAAGFEASQLGVSDRHERSFKKIVLWLGQLPGSAVLVHVNDKDVVLDPGTRFCPYGMLRWRYAAVPAMNYKTGGGFMTTPPPTEPSLLRRTVRVELAPDGSAKGEITVELRAQEAMEHRIEAVDTDEAGRRKSFEEEVQAWLPKGAVVKMISSEGWDATDDPLVAKFAVEIPNLASVAGKRIVAPAYFLPTPQKGMFARDSRIYPIVFPYPFIETDQVAIQLPAGYSMEVAPYRRKAALSYAGYEISSSLDGQQLVTSRSLRLDDLSFPPEKYFELKNFFGIVLAGDGGQAVLQAQPAAGTSKSQ